MKIDNSTKIRTLCGENMVIRQGEMNVNMTTVISLNNTAAELWKTFAGKDFEAKDIVDYLVAAYEIETDVATRDAQRWIEQMRTNKIIID